MNNSSLAIDSLLANWSIPFRRVHEGLNLLSTFSFDQLGSFHPGPKISYEERIVRQGDWLKNLSGMEEIDKQFFQNFWVPVQEDLSQWFIDLADPELPVIAGYYFELDPKGWHRNQIMNSLSDLILAIEDGLSRQKMVEIESQGQQHIFFNENSRRSEMLFNGELETVPVGLDEVFVEGTFTQPFAPANTSDFFLFNAQPLAIGLFPPETSISLNSVKCEHPTLDLSAAFESVNMIRHLMLLFRSFGQEYFTEFQLDLVDSDVSIWFNYKKELIVIGLNEDTRQKLLNRTVLISGINRSIL